jgi:hypothetical protein
MGKIKSKLKKAIMIIPPWAKISICIGAFSLVLYSLFVISPAFADFFNRYPAAFLRAIFAQISGILPCSIAEAFIIFSPCLLVAIIIYANKHYVESWRSVGRFLIITVSVASLFFSTFALNFGAGYHTSSVDELLGIDRRDVSAEELRETAEILVEEINKYADKLTIKPSGSSTMPYGYRKLSQKLTEAYSKVCDEHEFISRFPSQVKPVMLSEPWTYTHISGVYTYFSGEANINTNFPDYTLPYTAAHEMAHQRGIAREDEANFVAFLVCAASDDEYIRYSGYLNLYEYVANALYSADKEAYAEVRAKLVPEARKEMSAYSVFFDKYRENVAANVTGAVNNAYLTIQGTPGTKSYGMVVDLAVAYYRAEK